MDAGLAKYPVGRLVDKGTAQSRVVFASPPGVANPAAQIQYHSYMVDMCQVGLRRFETLLGDFQRKQASHQGPAGTIQH